MSCDANSVPPSHVILGTSVIHIWLPMQKLPLPNFLVCLFVFWEDFLSSGRKLVLSSGCLSGFFRLYYVASSSWGCAADVLQVIAKRKQHTSGRKHAEVYLGMCFRWKEVD